MITKIIVADDHPVVRQGLSTILETDSQFSVVGEAGNGLETIALVEKIQPHLLITDVTMSSLSGLEAVRQLKQRVPQTRIIFFTLHSSDSYVHEAFRNGANGYLLKGASREEILQAVRQVTAGQRYIAPDLAARLVNTYLDRAGQFVITDAHDELTNREREILQMVAEGATNVVIADRLCISARTVEIHRANVMRKLNLKTQSDLVRYAIKRGIISLEY